MTIPVKVHNTDFKSFQIIDKITTTEFFLTFRQVLILIKQHTHINNPHECLFRVYYLWFLMVELYLNNMNIELNIRLSRNIDASWTKCSHGKSQQQYNQLEVVMSRKFFNPVLFAVIALAITITSCIKKKSEESSELQKQIPSSGTAPAPGPKLESTQKSSSPVEVITGFNHLDSIIKNTPNDLLIFDLYADWCRPCKILAPVYSSLAQKHGAKARFFRIDIQKHRDIASAFRVNGIPLVVFMKDKEIVHAITGVRPAEHYESVITSCGASVSKEECRKKLEATL